MNSNHHVLPGAGETSAAPNLEYWEGIIAQGLPNREAVASALLEIHGRKLYQEGYGSFQAYLRQRWHFSRARGYQLLHFARLKQLSTAVDTPGPENERQARRLDAHGNGRRPEEDDPILQTMDYVVAAFGRLPPSEQREFISSLRDLLTELAQGLDRQAPAPAMA